MLNVQIAFQLPPACKIFTCVILVVDCYLKVISQSQDVLKSSIVIYQDIGAHISQQPSGCDHIYTSVTVVGRPGSPVLVVKSNLYSIVVMSNNVKSGHSCMLWDFLMLYTCMFSSRFVCSTNKLTLNKLLGNTSDCSRCEVKM